MEQINLSNFEPKVITPEKKDFGYSRILKGFPESVTMRSGMVKLRPNETVGIHSTGINEELLIILSGKGVFLITGREPVSVEEGQFFYCPPETEHNVKNTGNVSLHYVYVVSRAL